MVLKSINILNYKNIAEANLEFSPNVNCLIGNNGMGKTNVLDAIYYLSFTRNYNRDADSMVIKHGEDYMMLTGHYRRRDIDEDISIAVQRGKRKVVRRGGKEYERLSQHIGLLPLVMVSPMDWDLIRGAGEERRRLIDQIISQSDSEYLAALMRYNKALEQRNSMLRQGIYDPILLESVEHQLCATAVVVNRGRKRLVEQFTPIFMQYYNRISLDGEKVRLEYRSQLNNNSMEVLLAENRERDRLLGYTSHGVQRDDLELLLDGHSMRRTGSQGQCKTYTIALRLAQYDFLRKSNSTTPVLLLDDIFDKLDASRVESIVNIVSEDSFGQIFITDTNRSHLDEIIKNLGSDHCMLHVDDGVCTKLATTTFEQ